MKRYYDIGAFACSLYGALDSGIIIFSSVFDSLIKKLNYKWAIGVAIFTTIVTILFVDFGLWVSARTYFKRLYDGRNGVFKRTIMNWTLPYIIFGFFATLYITVNGRYFVTHLVSPPPTVVSPNYEEASKINNLTILISQKQSALKERERKEIRLINPKLVKEANSGSEWAKNKLNSEKRIIHDKYTKLHLELNDELEENIKSYRNAMSIADTIAIKQNQLNLADYKTSTDTLNNLQFAFAIISTFGLIYFTYLSVQEERYVKGKTKSPDKEVYTGEISKSETNQKKN